MSGHSKWANIQHRKGRQDALRGKVFTKAAKEIIIAAKGGGDPAGNSRLRAAIAAAKAVNLPKDRIQAAIRKGTGEDEGGNIEEVFYEGYGPGGIAIIVETATDNKNRTVADVRHLFSKHGGNLGETGCVSWMFKQKAVFVVEKEKFEDEDALMDIVLEAGAEDMKAEDDVFEITAEPGDFNAVEAALAEKGIETASAEITMVPDTTVHLEGKDAQKMLDLIDAFEESDDVQNVYANYEIDEDSLEG